MYDIGFMIAYLFKRKTDHNFYRTQFVVLFFCFVWIFFYSCFTGKRDTKLSLKNGCYVCGMYGGYVICVI